MKKVGGIIVQYPHRGCDLVLRSKQDCLESTVPGRCPDTVFELKTDELIEEELSAFKT